MKASNRPLYLSERGTPVRRTIAAASVIASLTSMAAMVACTGAVSGTPGGGAGSNSSASSSGSSGKSGVDGSGASAGTAAISQGGSGQAVAPLDCTVPKPGEHPIQRLTRYEYTNTVRDLLGVTKVNDSLPGDNLPPEQKGNGFSNDAAIITTTRLLVDAYSSTASAIAKLATGDAASLAKATKNCDPKATGEAACAEQFINDFGSRAFRRALDTDEHDAMTAVYQAGKSGGAYADGISAVIEMVLQAPQYLYKVEFGTKSDSATVARPTSYEMATRLSYLLWGSIPDDALTAAAKADQLATREQVAAQAKRMLDDQRAHNVITYFHDRLLGIDGLDSMQRDATAFPTYTPALGTAFRLETENFLDDLVFQGGDFATMFTAKYTFLNGTLAQFYGVPNITGSQFQKVDVNPAQRGGLLTQASLLTAYTPGSHNNPVIRAKFVLQQLLCSNVPDPPPALAAMIKEPAFDPTTTTRQRFEAHANNPICSGCHVKLDGIGFAFEHFDPLGGWQQLDNGQPIDTSGHVADTDAIGDFNGVLELEAKLAKSHDAQACYTGNWLNFAYGRTAGSEDACTHQALNKALTDANGNIKALVLALAQTDAFLYRPLVNP
ncbi:MAG: DUF1592 domain-containing protein [Polyangiaceae bacterium]